MNNQEFIEESKQYVDDLYHEFCEYQNMVWEIFVWFNRFCRKHKIEYYIAYGSLIGAIRDKGSIPWDYDMDVIVKIDDKEKLIQLLESEIDDTMYFTHTGNVDEYPTCCLRICKKGFPFTSIHLDVFFLIGNPENEPQKFVDKVEHYHVLREIKYGEKWYPQDKSRSKAKRILDIYRKFRRMTISAEKLKSFEKKVVEYFPLGSTQYCSVHGDPYKKVYYFEDFSDAIDISVKGEMVSIPVGYDRYLSTIYKDYNSYLPIAKRFDEFYRMTSEVRNRNRFMQYDTTGIFDFCK